MGLLRIILLIGNAGYFAFFGYLSITERQGAWWAPLALYALVTCLALNFIYLLLSVQPSDWRTPNWRIPNWRVFRLIGLWFDAKESELRRRADRSRQD